MKRKINLVGQSTLTVSLPSKWVEKNNVKKGDEIDVVEKDNSLIIGVNRGLATKDIDFKINKKEELLNRIVFGPYMKGYSSVTYRFDDSAVASKLMSSAKKMVGFEIVEQTGKMIRLEQVSSGLEQNFSKLMCRLFFIIKENSNVLRKFLENPTDDFTVLSELEFECDKISLYCRRLINTNSLNKSLADTTSFYNLLCLLEMLGDELEDMADYFEDGVFKKYKYDTKLDALFGVLLKSIDVVFSKVNKFLDNKTSSTFEMDLELGTLRKEFKKKYFELKTDNQNIILAHHLFSCINHIKHMSQDMY